MAHSSPAVGGRSDGINTYTWDGESQLASAAGVNYSYDGDGRRVAKVGSKFYWYGSGDEILAETDDSGNTLNEYVFFGGRRVAVLPSTGGPLYYGSDMLGTSRVMVEANGTLCYDADFTPFGAEVPYTSNCSQNYKFEGKERDTETANDYFGARYYSSHFGRWLSADWSSVPAPVPYANLTNPQTLNLYSMVSDDPESFADLDGHENTTPAWERSDGQPNSCKGPTPDDCGTGTTQPNPQAQQQKPCPVDACVTATPDPPAYKVVPRIMWSWVLKHTRALSAGLFYMGQNGKAMAAQNAARNFMKSAKPDPGPSNIPPAGEPKPPLLPENENTRMLKAIEEGLSELSGALSEAASGALEGFAPGPVYIPEKFTKDPNDPKNLN